MPDSGNASLSTTGQTAVILLAASTGFFKRVTFVNKGSVDVQCSIDGKSWRLLPGPGSRTFRDTNLTAGALVRAVPGGSDGSGLWADAD